MLPRWWASARNYNTVKKCIPLNLWQREKVLGVSNLDQIRENVWEGPTTQIIGNGLDRKWVKGMFFRALNRKNNVHPYYENLFHFFFRYDFLVILFEISSGLTVLLNLYCLCPVVFHSSETPWSSTLMHGYTCFADCFCVVIIDSFVNIIFSKIKC